MAFCEESLLLIGRQMAARATYGEGAIPPGGIGMKSKPSETRVNRETAELTRALAEDVRDPEVRRLLHELADRYDKLRSSSAGHCGANNMITPDGKHLPLDVWK